MFETIFFYLAALIMASFAGFCVGKKDLADRRRSFFYANLIVIICTIVVFRVVLNWYK